MDTTVQSIGKICVVGAGIMGQQIALCAALAGYYVACTDVAVQPLQEAERFVSSYLGRQVEKGRLTEEQVGRTRTCIDFTSAIEEGASGADFVIEAIVEDLECKRELFRTLDGICAPHVILSTNSSTFVSSAIAGCTNRPDKVVNMHFFNPALVMKLVEVVRGPHVSQNTIDKVVALSVSMDKVPIVLQREVPGFVVNRIMDAITREALYLLDTGVASHDDIDNAVVYGLRHPMGPFRLMDLTGIDLEYQIALQRYRESGDPADKPSPAIVEKYVRGEWGEKAGVGFYSYAKSEGRVSQ